MLGRDTRERSHSEAGWIEQGSIVLWAALAALVLVRLRPPTVGSIAGAIVCLGGAAREADLHKRFTEYSVLKVGFYLKDEYPLDQRALFGAFFIVLLTSLITLGIAMLQAARGAGKPTPAWLKVGAIGMALLVMSKLMDRAPGMLKDLNGHVLDERWSGPLKLLEEGYELALPVVFGVAVWLYGGVRQSRESGGVRAAVGAN